MITPEEAAARKAGVEAATELAEAIAVGRVGMGELEAEFVAAARELVGTVAGPGDALWPLQCDIARQVLTAGGIAASELVEWVAVQRAREGLAVEPRVSWIERVLADGADEGDGDC